MNKIASLLGTAALALGLASCSGGMHDAVADPYIPKAGSSVFLVGGLEKAYVAADQYISKDTASLSGQTVFEVELKDGQFSVAFSYQGADSWGGGSGEINIGILSNVDNGWSPDVRWGGVSPIGADKGAVDIEAGTTNITLSGMKSDNQYVLSGELYPAGGKLSLEDKGEFTIPVPNYLLLDGYFILGEMNEYKPDFEWLLMDGMKDAETGDVVYVYEFTPKRDSYSFGIAADSKWKTCYKNAAVKCDDVSTVGTRGTKLTKYVDNKDAEGNGGSDATITGLFKDLKTTLTVTTTEKGDVYVKVASGNDYDFAYEAGVLGDFDNAAGILFDGGSITLEYKDTMKEWGGGNGTCYYKVLKNLALSWDGGDLGGGAITGGTVPDGISIGEANGNAMIKGLQDGVTYKLTWTPNDDITRLTLDIEIIE